MIVEPASRRSSATPPARLVRGGFTLVEMLIAVALTLLIMTLFAQVFELASGSITLQQALGENDQQVRTFTTVLRSDLRKRTFRELIPFREGQTSAGSLSPFGSRRGYFYVSTNDPNDPRDTVLQFTVSSKVLVDSSDETEYYGRATALDSPFNANLNQPEHDDGQPGQNQAASSSAAQVCYFLRSGRLYRRVVLLRDPWFRSGSVQPTRTSDDADFFDHSSPLILGGGQYARHPDLVAAGLTHEGEFWEDFDYAAFGSSGAKFLGTDSLNNDGSPPQSLGIPVFRFGFNQSATMFPGGASAFGVSREFSTGDPAAGFFLGRYTHEETSHPDFNFPQTGSNKFDYTAFTPIDTTPIADEVVDQFADGPRRGADLLLSHVHSFEVLLWDTRVGRFLPLGHNVLAPGPDGVSGTADDEPGDFHIDRNRQLASGQIVVPGDPATYPASWRGKVFDTWHQSVNLNGDTLFDPPPYRPLLFYPTTSPARPAVGYHAPQLPDWDGAVPSYNSEDMNRNGRLDPGEDGSGGFPANGRLDGDKIFPAPIAGTDPGNFDFYYECLVPGTPGTVEPSWPRTIGGTTIPATPADAQFVAVPNLAPLRAIQIRVRFLHLASNKIRQLTLVHSLVDGPL